VPAIICGAGPSLEKNLPLLKTLTDRALIFAGGSSLNALSKAGVRPHFGAGVDPNPMQTKRLEESNSAELPFFYRNRLNHGAFNLLTGPLLYVTGAGGFKTPGYFEKELGIEREWIEEGHNVVNFCVELAHEMGCNPIIFVGMDLAYTGLKGYASGVVEDSTVSPTEILGKERDDDRAILKEDIYGKPIYTLWKWIAESKWIGKYAETHPEIGMVNCTEGGLGFPCVENRTLKHVAEEFLTRQYELRDRVHGEIQDAAMPQVTSRKVVKLMHELEKSLRRTINHFEVLLKDVNAEMEKVKAGEEHGQSGLAALAETEIGEEPGYEYVVDPFNDVIGKVMASEAHTISLRKFSKGKKEIKLLELKRRKMVFLRDVALANAELILYSLKNVKKERRKEPKHVDQVLNLQPLGIYLYKNEIYVINDPELGMNVHEKFAPTLLPKGDFSGTTLSDGSTLKTVFNKDLVHCESYLEKAGKLHGQWQLYFPNGDVKQEGFYKDGKLHGPVRFYGPQRQLLAESWFFEGERQGSSWWNYPEGMIYSAQKYKDNEWIGPQEYYNRDTTLRTRIEG
jgi:hypothetical protein